MTLRHSARVSGKPSFGIGRASDELIVQGFIVPASTLSGQTYARRVQRLRVSSYDKPTTTA